MYTKQDILTLVEDEDVQFIRLQFSDLSGHVKNIAITVSQLEKALNNEFIFDGSAISGFADVTVSDMYLHPNLDTFEIFPWRPHQGKVARFICDVYTYDHKPFEGDPRYVLKQVLSDAKAKGYEFYVGPECEFFLFNTDDSGNPIACTNDEGGYFDVAPLDNGENCRREIVLTLEDMDFEVESSHHETSAGQHEVDFKYDEILTTADRIMTFKMVVKTIAKRHGLHATFMPKPLNGQPGSGMHLNFSLFKKGEDLFADGDKLSGTAKSFIAGLLKYAPEIACLTNPTINSYKRLIPDPHSPCHIAWSEINRSLAVRVPADRHDGAKIEFRTPDPSSNPYLALAACIKAGLRGIEENLQAPPKIDTNVYALTQNEREKLGIGSMPHSLNEAIKNARNSQLVHELLGDGLFRRYLDAKSREYEEYRQYVGEWEIKKYLIQY
jgi:glutamine synthetase